MFNRNSAKRIIVCFVIFIAAKSSYGQHSVARQWNEVLLEAIRNDFARPTVHARNLFHLSAAMYDGWAVFEPDANPYLLGNQVHGFQSDFDGFSPGSSDLMELQEEVISYTAYRLITHRFASSPGWMETSQLADDLMEDLGYSSTFTSTNFSIGSAAALGNYIAETYISYGNQDGANEQGDYENLDYTPINEFLNASTPGNPNITMPNRWQPLAFDVFIDQSGNEIPGAVPDFLSPEWGAVAPFSLSESDKIVINKDGYDFEVYHDPGPPPYIDPANHAISEDYKMGFAMVSIWSSHLDPANSTLIDISPASIGNFNIDDLPTEFSDYDQFYHYFDGGDVSPGRATNPVTEVAYEPQLVRLGDYGRVLAEFWADGPDSETPPGHWFTLLNYVNDHPDFEKKFEGRGKIWSDLDWDIVSYFFLGGAMHDVAITAWGIKGYYDYIRPVSAIRYMADQGQSSDTQLPNFSEAGIPLVEGYIELVLTGDPLVGVGEEHLNKIKIKAWRGPDFIEDAETDVAGVDWILAENWWPYQRPTFVTPPFAGYISGHSTYSRAAAELLTAITGSAYFPGGMGEFIAEKDNFLVFEKGPSEDVTLQWATYQDASDQCSLSRIWGGIHPPADDLPGRIIGQQIGQEAFEFGKSYLSEEITGTNNEPSIAIYPNPVKEELLIQLEKAIETELEIWNLNGQLIHSEKYTSRAIQLNLAKLSNGMYLLRLKSKDFVIQRRIVK